jgi:hypothetical protein
MDLIFVIAEILIMELKILFEVAVTSIEKD